MIWTLAAFGISLLAVLFFRRCDPAPQKIRPRRDTEKLTSPPLELVQAGPMPVHLTPLTSKHRAYHPMRILLAELHLLRKGVRWWWYVLFIGLNVAGVLLPTESARRYLLPVAWIVPPALWSGLGTREKCHNTDPLVFSAPHPLKRQFPFMWLAGVAVTLITGAGVGISLANAGKWIHLVAWSVGALFIPKYLHPIRRQRKLAQSSGPPTIHPIDNSKL